jgi:hypothetical protein
LFKDGTVIRQLQMLEARVAMMVSDHSSQRAAVINLLNRAGIPVVGIPLLPAEDGYYFTVENVSRAAMRYGELTEWSRQHSLAWDRIGLDVEPEARFYEQIMSNPWRLPLALLPRLCDRGQLTGARAEYGALIDRIHGDGWTVENYQFPLIADERRVGASVLQRLLGLVDLSTDREVWMLYSSFMRALGPGLLWSYGREADAIAVGTTGGGPDVPGHPQMPALSWQEFARDLRLAGRWCEDVYVHSLEGCVWQGFLDRLGCFEWAGAGRPRTASLAEGLRLLLRAALWSSVRPRQAAFAATAVGLGLRQLLRSSRGSRAWRRGVCAV